MSRVLLVGRPTYLRLLVMLQVTGRRSLSKAVALKTV